MKKIIYVLIIFILFTTRVYGEEVNLIRDSINGVSVYFYDKNQSRYRFLQAEKYFFGENIAYCIDIGAKIKTEVYYPSMSLEEANLPKDVLDKIRLISYYGYSYPGHNTDKYYMATQDLIWNTIDKLELKWTENFTTYHEINIDNERNNIKYLCDSHYVKPSFDDKEIKFIGEKIELIDNNNVLNRYEVNNENVKIDGNKLIIGENFKGTEITLTKPLYKGKNFLLYSNGLTQKMISPGEIKDITSKVKVKEIKGSVEVIKKDGENYSNINGAEYYLYDDNNNFVDKIVSGEKNRIENLKVGSYTLIEKKAPKGYMLDNHKYVIVISNYKYDYKLELYDDIIKRKIEIFKVFSDNKDDNLVGEANIKFDIYKDNKIYSSITTDDKGHAYIILPYGTYVFKQVNTTNNYEKVKDFTVKIDEYNDKPIYKLLSDKKITSKLKVIKKDIDTNKNIVDSNIKFKIFDVNNNKYLKIKMPSTNRETDEFIIDNKGMFITPISLEPGKYILEEVSGSTNPYLLNTTKKEFTIDENTNFIKINDENYLEITFYNKIVKGYIKLNKNGEKVEFNNNKILYSDINLEGVEFTLYAKEDILENGFLVYKKDSIIAKKLTDKDGEIIFDNLPLGKYYLKETKSINNYQENKKIYDIELSYIDDKTKTVKANLKVKNELLKGNLIINKLEKGTNNKISNTLIEIRDIKNNVVYKEYTDREGKINVSNLPYGKYYLSELEAKTGYRLLEDNIYFEINKDKLEINVYNERIKVPNTGLNINYINFVLLIIFSIILLLSVIFLKNKLLTLLSIILIISSISLISLNLYNNYIYNIIPQKYVEKNIEEPKKELPKETVDEKYDYKAILEIPVINLKRGILDINNKYNLAKYNIELVQETDDFILLASHNGNNYNSFFKDLHKLELGDSFFYEKNNIKEKYIVSDIYEIKKDGYANIYRKKDVKTIALVTCKNHTNDAQIVYIGYKRN